MGIKLNWFKMLWLNSDERAALKKARDSMYDIHKTEPKKQSAEVVVHRPYSNVIYAPSLKSITVIFMTGEIISKQGVDRELFEKVRNAATKTEIENLLLDKVIAPESNVVETAEERQLIKDNLYVFRDNPDFEVINNEVYLKPAKLPLPAIVAATFIEILEKIERFEGEIGMRDGYGNPEGYEELTDAYETLRMFWLKLAMNPLPQSREDTLLFVKVNDVHLTRNGNMVLYRRIVKQGDGNKTLVKFISQEYFKLKKWKKSPRKFEVGVDSTGSYTIYGGKRSKNVKRVGNLEKLYKKLPTMVENNYTSQNNRGQLTIRIGALYQIPETEIDLNNGICAAGGLHAACSKYDYSGFGDTPVVVLVNPSKAITVPRGDTGKLRTTEMFVACINDKRAGEHYDENELDVFDEEYHDLTIKQLEDAVATKDYSTLRVKGTKPSVTPTEVVDILGALKNRVKQIE